MGAYKQAVEFLDKGNRKAYFVTVPSIFIDYFFVGFNIYLGVLTASWWHIMLSLYYVLLLFLRNAVIMRAGRAIISRNMAQRQIKNHHKFGFSLLMMDIVMAISMYLMLQNKIAKPFNILLIVPIAFYTVYKVIMAIINLFKAHKSKSLFIIELRKICQADALISILMLESALINKFGDLKNMLYYDISLYSGAVVCLIIFLMAVTSLFYRAPKSEV